MHLCVTVRSGADMSVLCYWQWVTHHVGHRYRDIMP